ncbi:MAG: hypothetical protein ACTS3F_14705 [Phycisphaerales bacterium]
MRINNAHPDAAAHLTTRSAITTADPAPPTPPPAGWSGAGYLMAAGIAIITATLIFKARTRRRARRNATSTTTPATPTQPTLAHHANAHADAEASRQRLIDAERESRSRQTLEALMVEVQELTRLCAAQIENRAVRLERLIADADARITELRQAAAEVQSQHPHPSAQPPAQRPPSTPTPTPTPAPTVRPIRAHHNQHADQSALPPEALRASSILTNRAADHNEPPVDPLTRRVYHLADQGLDPLAIARKLEEQIGKVQLILSLRPRPVTAPHRPHA